MSAIEATLNKGYQFLALGRLAGLAGVLFIDSATRACGSRDGRQAVSNYVAGLEKPCEARHSVLFPHQGKIKIR